MKKEYDFTNAKKNPYASKLKKQITINLNEEVLVYFKNMSEETGIPYQSLINLYLLDCVNNKKTIKFEQGKITICVLVNAHTCSYNIIGILGGILHVRN